MATKNHPRIETRESTPLLGDNQTERPEGQNDPSQVNTAKQFKILVSGKTCSGKSTLVNAMLGVTLPFQAKAEEGKSISEVCTTEVTPYHVKKGNVDVTIWDSPGIQDGTGNLQQMKEKCSEIDLTLHCIDVRQTRFLDGLDDNPDVVAIKREFGPQLWSNTVIVLTFSNCIADDVNIKYLQTEEEKTQAVEAKLQEWKDQIVKILAKIDQEAAEKILIVPAGYYCNPHLPGWKFWLSNLWDQCLAAVSTQEGKLALLKANFDHMNTEDVKEEDLKDKAGCLLRLWDCFKKYFCYCFEIAVFLLCCNRDRQ